MLCLRIHRGLPLRRNDETWARKKAAQAAQFFSTDLAAHFKAEEEALFPAMRDFSGASALLSELLAEHRKLEALAERLRGTAVATLVDALGEFADMLEAHIRKEERELFPLYEKQMSPDMAAEVGRGIKNIIGNAMQPRNPELLE
jgi:hemerythrin-like domain-containing protein